MLLAVIPAAGHSRRMGRPKLSLPLGGLTVLQRTVAALRQAGIAHVLVVVGPHVPELVPLAEAAGASTLLLPEETPDMRATVCHGLHWLGEKYQPPDEAAWLLVPADHSTLDPMIVRALVQERDSHPGHSVFVPTYLGRRGHPTLIGWKHVGRIGQFPPGQGLNAYLRGQAHETLEVPVQSAVVLTDLDTPEDYEKLRRRFEE